MKYDVQKQKIIKITKISNISQVSHQVCMNFIANYFISLLFYATLHNNVIISAKSLKNLLIYIVILVDERVN